MTEAHRFIWVQGDHEPTPPTGVGGEWVEAFPTTTLTFPSPSHARCPSRDLRPSSPQGDHPSARHPAQPPVLRGRLAAPHAAGVFGAHIGGLDVRDPAISRLFPRGGRAFLLGRDRLFSFALGTLRSG